MDADLIAELASAAPVTVLLISVKIDDTTTIRWTDGGFVFWGGDLYEARTAFGVVSEIGEISDGIDGEASSSSLTVFPAGDDAFSALIDPAAQGAVVTMSLGAVDFQTGLVIGAPDLLMRCELDVARLTGTGDALILDCITEEARMLEVNDERRLTDSFHRSVWPGELGYANVTGLDTKVYWRANDPNNAISR